MRQKNSCGGLSVYLLPLGITQDGWPAGITMPSNVCMIGTHPTCSRTSARDVAMRYHAKRRSV